MYFLEYSQLVVDAGLAPGTLCRTPRIFGQHGMTNYTARAERVYELVGNTIIDIKHRYDINSTSIISDEDKLVLILKAVLI